MFACSSLTAGLNLWLNICVHTTLALLVWCQIGSKAKIVPTTRLLAQHIEANFKVNGCLALRLSAWHQLTYELCIVSEMQYNIQLKFDNAFQALKNSCQNSEVHTDAGKF